jgi:hypothetical protein
VVHHVNERAVGHPSKAAPDTRIICHFDETVERLI